MVIATFTSLCHILIDSDEDPAVVAAMFTIRLNFYWKRVAMALTFADKGGEVPVKMPNLDDDGWMAIASVMKYLEACKSVEYV